MIHERADSIGNTLSEAGAVTPIPVSDIRAGRAITRRSFKDPCHYISKMLKRQAYHPGRHDTRATSGNTRDRLGHGRAAKGSGELVCRNVHHGRRKVLRPRLDLSDSGNEGMMEPSNLATSKEESSER